MGSEMCIRDSAKAAQAKGAIIVENCAARMLSTSGGKVSGVVTERGEIKCDQVLLAGGLWSRRFLANHKVKLPTLQLLGSVLDIVVQRRRNTKAAIRLLRKLLKNQGIKPTKIVTDRLGSYGAALKLLGLKHLQDVGGRKNNRAECSHIPIRRRERKSQKFRSVKNAQKLLSAHGQIYNLFNYRRHLISRNSLRKFRSHAQIEWNIIAASTCA